MTGREGVGVQSPATLGPVHAAHTYGGVTMARIRPAVRCAAHRTNGEACRCFAMLGCRVCHAHGGRAPQVRQAAERRVIKAAAMTWVSRELERLRLERAALAPWAPAVRWETALAPLRPMESARRLRVMAREMTAAARDLRDQARRLDAKAEARNHDA
jgi:hypothetical protein